jgi:Ca2+-binding EF-hand superfamily protein
MATSLPNVAMDDDVLEAQPVSQDSPHMSLSDSSNGTATTKSSKKLPPTSSDPPTLVRGVSLDMKTMKSMSLQCDGTSDEIRLEAVRVFKWLDSDCDDLLTLDDVRPLIDNGGAKAWFDNIDEAGSGTLNEDQFVQGFSALMSPPPTVTPRSHFSHVGSLAFKIKTRSFRSYDSFSLSKSWKNYMKKSQHDRAIKTFHQIDSNKDGVLSLDEVIAAAPKLSISEEEAVSWFTELNIDRNGAISAHEFEIKYKASSTFQALIGALHDAVDSAADFATYFIEEEHRLMHETFSAAEELGRGALARAFKGHQISALALRLLRGHKVYSRNWKSDLWLHLKNKQIFLSLFCVHPDHPFSKRERISALAVSFLLAWGLEFWFCALWTSCDEHPNLNFFEVYRSILHVFTATILYSTSATQYCFKPSFFLPFLRSYFCTSSSSRSLFLR